MIILEEIMTLEMLIGLFGGLGLFVFGMHMMSEGLKTVAGTKMKKLLEVLTNNKVKAILVGTVVTMIVQSSSTTTVMVVGFVNAALMTLTQAAGVILGANIGTTVTAQLIAFNVTELAPVFIGFGALITLFSSRKKIGIGAVSCLVLGSYSLVSLRCQRQWSHSGRVRISFICCQPMERIHYWEF